MIETSGQFQEALTSQPVVEVITMHSLEDLSHFAKLMPSTFCPNAVFAVVDNNTQRICRGEDRELKQDDEWRAFCRRVFCSRVVPCLSTQVAMPFYHTPFAPVADRVLSENMTFGYVCCVREAGRVRRKIRTFIDRWNEGLLEYPHWQGLKDIVYDSDSDILRSFREAFGETGVRHILNPALFQARNKSKSIQITEPHSNISLHISFFVFCFFFLFFILSVCFSVFLLH